MKMNRTTPQSIKEQILLFPDYKHRFNIKKNSHSLFCFFEGSDCHYYYDKIRYKASQDVIVIKCGNKKNVISAYDSLFEKNKEKIKMAFFIDRDFDVSIKNPVIYETEGYSIENYYCSWDVFCRIVEYGFNVKMEYEDLSVLHHFYNDNLDSFHDVVGEFNAFNSLLRKYDRENGEMHRSNLGLKFDTNLGDIRIGNFQKKYNLQDLFNKYSDGHALFSEEEVKAEEERLRVKGASKYFRGKYEIQFLFILLTFLIEDANTRKSILKNSTIKSSLSLNTIMNDFSQYAECPESLLTYIEKANNKSLE